MTDETAQVKGRDARDWPFFVMANRLWRNPKLATIRRELLGAWLLCISYASDEATDGRLDAGALRLLRLTDRVVNDLVECGLLDRDAEGYVIHDFLRHQTSAAVRSASAERKRQVQTERKRRHRARVTRDVTQDVTQKSVTQSVTVTHVTGEVKKGRSEEELITLSCDQRATRAGPEPPPTAPQSIPPAPTPTPPEPPAPEPPPARPPDRPGAFALPVDWTPSDQDLAGAGAPSGAPLEYVRDALGSFRSYWTTRSVKRTQPEWLAALTTWVGRDWHRERHHWLDRRREVAKRFGKRHPPGPPPDDKAVWSEEEDRWEWPARVFGVPGRDSFERLNPHWPYAERDSYWHDVCAMRAKHEAQQAAQVLAFGRKHGILKA